MDEHQHLNSVLDVQALTGAQQAAASQPASERCPQCGNSFRTLQELLFHVEAYHPDGTASSGMSASWRLQSTLIDIAFRGKPISSSSRGSVSAADLPFAINFRSSHVHKVENDNQDGRSCHDILCEALKEPPLTTSSWVAGVEQCPHCGQSFANAVTLVEHVERNHARKELCVLC